jgi:uncharacterized protein involved in outer membrane biogenesis
MKKLLVALGVLIAVVAGALAVVVANLESYLNDNREWISSQVESVLGRPVSFGEVGVSLVGGLGARVTDLRIDDDPAFSKEPFVTAGAIDLQVSLVPALFGNIEVDHVILRSPSITVVQTARGLSTSTLGAGPPEKAAPEPVPEPEGDGAAIPAFVVASVEVSDGTFRFVDETASPAAETSVEQFDFTAANIRLEGAVPFEMEAAILGASRQNVRIVGQVSDLQNPKAEFTLTSGALELGQDAAGAPAHTLRDLALEGSLAILAAGPRVDAAGRSPRGTLSGVEYREFAIDFGLQNQIATIETLSVSVFDGDVQVSGRYDMRNEERPRFDVKTTLSKLRLEQIVASQSPESAEKMQGEVGGALTLGGAGTDWEQIKKSLTGQGNVLFVDGVLKDVNIADTALEGVTGVPGLSNALPASLRSRYPEVFGTGDTVFEKMDGKIDIRDARVDFRDFRLAARDYAVAGQGSYSLENQLDMSTVMTFSQALSDDLVEAAQPMAYLRSPEGRVAFPVKLTGAPPDIQTVPDVAYIAKAASREAAGRLIDQALGTGGEETPQGGERAPSSAEEAGSELIKKGLGELFR